MAHANDRSGGCFRSDLEWLLQEMSKPAIIELGVPRPNTKYLPVRRAAKCHATHNRRLLDRVADPDAEGG